MFKNERQAYILKQINLHNKVSSSELSTQLNVSEDTIRRDLTELADAGELVKVHGGALSKSYHYPAQQSKVYAQTEKKIIAGKALQLIKPGMTILTEAGTTMLELVKILPRELEATFFTVSPLMALNLAEYPQVTVVLLGGEIDMASQITIGARPIQELASIKVDLCILGVNALNAKDGLTEIDWRVAQVKKAMIEAGHRLAVLTISEKLDSTFKMQICQPERINYLITELNPRDKKLNAYRKKMHIL
ncbi:MAG: DeoR/GlpR transcriptional regulator [Chitinophagaceae bacterium]|nr:DeoR/GlpR transcriptional regulator [Chitinophagaceae bacterium]MCW5928300.1 DeoR/GlpR transcriptional regulator [Chitinophagaceae bacterium]